MGTQVPASLQKALKDKVVKTSDGNTYRCVVCNNTATGNIPADAHLRGSTHREAGAKYAIQHITDAKSSLTDFLSKKTKEAAKKGVIKVKNNNIKCIPCSTELSGIAPLEQHLNGDGHKKQMDLQNRKAVPQISNKPAPIQHKASASEYSVTQETDTSLARLLRENMVIETDDKESPFLCRLCTKRFNSSETLYDHINSKLHAKKKREQQLREDVVGFPAMPQPPSIKSLDNCDSYPVNSNPRGLVYIFNNTFKGIPDIPTRNGAEIDSLNLHKKFTGMQYKVFLKEDLSREDTLTALERIRREPDLSKVDSLIFFILSHGNDAYSFQANDGEAISFLNLRRNFTDRKCPHMKGKPKIFFTNYCRGSQMQRKEEDAVEAPRDMYTIHAATEGISVLRCPDRGTYMVQCLCEILENGKELKNEVYPKLCEKMRAKNVTDPMTENHVFKYLFYF